MNNRRDDGLEAGQHCRAGELGNDGFFTSTDYAKDHHLQPRLARQLEFPSGKKTP